MTICLSYLLPLAEHLLNAMLRSPARSELGLCSKLGCLWDPSFAVEGTNVMRELEKEENAKEAHELQAS